MQTESNQEIVKNMVQVVDQWLDDRGLLEFLLLFSVSFAPTLSLFKVQLHYLIMYVSSKNCSLPGPPVYYKSLIFFASERWFIAAAIGSNM